MHSHTCTVPYYSSWLPCSCEFAACLPYEGFAADSSWGYIWTQCGGDSAGWEEAFHQTSIIWFDEKTDYQYYLVVNHLKAPKVLHTGWGGLIDWLIDWFIGDRGCLGCHTPRNYKRLAHTDLTPIITSLSSSLSSHDLAN